MIPRVASGGASFKGAFLYYMHDKEENTRERVAWTSVENMNTESPDKAWRVMAYTAREQERLKEATGQSRAGRKLEKPVFAFSLAWHPEQSPDAGHMLDTARSALTKLGLQDHEAVIIAHDDEPQKHVHVVVNRVHPLTGMAGDIRNSKRKLSDFSREYERDNGKIYCDAREKNFERRQKGGESFYEDPVLADSWKKSRNGEEFKAALEEKGYILAQGRKRLVVVDPYGKIHNPTRLLNNVRAADLRERISDLDLNALPNAENVAANIKQRGERGEEGREVVKDRETSQRADAKAAPERDFSEEETAESKPEAEAVRQAAPDNPRPSLGKSAFEELAAHQTRELQERQAEEMRQLRERLRARVADSKERLSAYHELPQRKAELHRLRNRIEKASWWKRLSGAVRRDQLEMQNQVKAYRKEVAEFRESIAHVKDHCRTTLSEMGLRHQLERERLERNIERLRDRDEQPRDRDEPTLTQTFEKEATRERDQGRGR